MGKVLCVMCLKAKAVLALLLCWVLVCMFSCDSNKVGTLEHPGALQFGLDADTSGIQGGVEVTKASLPNLESFLNTDLYKIEILQGEAEQVIQSFEHYKDMPELVELERGNYKIRASRGELRPAAFESPRFEGVSDFIIKENMTTKLDVTCSLANARVTVAYTDSFKVVYPHYTLVLGSSHTTTDSLRYVQDETRAGWFQVNASGENLSGILTVKPDTGEVKQFAVTIPSVKPKDNVHMVFNSTPNTRPDQGLTVKITINDETIEKPIYVYVPDYMLPVDAALLEPHGFAHEDPIVLGKDDKVAVANVKMYVPGTIENCKLAIWQDQGQPVEYDLAHLNAADKAALNELGFNLPDIWRKKQVSLDFKPVIEKLARIPQGETSVKRFNYRLIVTDSLVNPHVSKPLTLAVKMIPDVAPKVLLSDGFISSQAIQVTEGGFVYSDGVKKNPKYVATIESSIALSICKLKITDARGQVRSYDLKRGEPVPGVKYDLSASTPLVDFKEAISALTLDDDNIKRYEYELTVQTELDGAVYEDIKTLIIDLLPPKFEITMNGDLEENGDAFAKRAVLRAQTKTGDPSKLIFQLFENGNWTDIPSARIAETSVKDDAASIIVTGLTPETQYRVRAKYGKHVSGEKTFTTEKADTDIPNKRFEDWQNIKVDNARGTGGLDIYELFPFMPNQDYWDTRNPLTTSPRPSGGTLEFVKKATYYYRAFSGVIPVTGYIGKAAEISTLGWGVGNTFTELGGEVQNRTAGALFIGDYNLDTRQELLGRPFNARPTKMKFYHKYKSINNERFKVEIVLQNRESGLVELGRGVLISSEQKVDFTLTEVDINYTNYSLKATHISILFLSSTEDAPATNKVKGSKGAFDGYSDSKYVGSVLTVDEMDLIYE